MLLDALDTGGQQVMGIVLEMLIEEAQQIVRNRNDPTRDAELLHYGAL